MTHHAEDKIIAAAGKGVARAAARAYAIEARGLLARAESVLVLADQTEAAVIAHNAGERTTDLLRATATAGDTQVFACKR